MEWSMVLTIVGTNITLMAFFAGFIFWVVNRFDSDMKNIASELKEENRRMDQLWMESNRRMDGVYHILLKKTDL